ncbi:hypothetical protein SALWKB2_0001 [Snodgrassella alvi wkB2]|nr:hypothetical protein SALWKB2_0001 [Snodgrassella alvi wkB2]
MNFAKQWINYRYQNLFLPIIHRKYHQQKSYPHNPQIILIRK